MIIRRPVRERRLNDTQRGAQFWDLSSTGTLVYVRGRSDIAVTVTGASAQATELWVFDHRASTLQRLTFGSGTGAGAQY